MHQNTFVLMEGPELTFYLEFQNCGLGVSLFCK